MNACDCRAGVIRSCFHKIRSALSGLPALAGIVAATHAGAAPLFPNGGFESGFEEDFNKGWYTHQNVAVKQGAPYTAAEGVRLAAFNSGNSAPGGNLSRYIRTIPGKIYRLEFSAGVLSYVNGSQRMRLDVLGRDRLVWESITFTGKPGGQIVWQDHVFYFIADWELTSLTFRDDSDQTTGIDMVLDDVIVEEVTEKPLVNGGLENGASGWTLTGNVRATPVPAYQPRDGTTVASFNTGDSVPNGRLSQTVTTTPGRKYILQYSVGILSYRKGWQKMEPHITGLVPGSVQFSQGAAGKGTVEWYNSTLPFTATQPLTRIEFVDTSDETRSVDLLIDKVSLIPAPLGYTVLFPDTFTMGSPADEYGHAFNETRHSVTFTNGRYVKTTEVTWNEWNDVLSLGPSRGYSDIAPGRNGFNGSLAGDHPVTEVSWWDVVKWCNLMSEEEGLRPVYYTSPLFGAANVLRTGTPEVHADWTAEGYRLPTEAEWEHLCRSGNNTAYFTGSAAPYGMGGDATLDHIGWYAANSGNNTHPVATKRPNWWGVHDTHGNVWEWCWDRFDDTDYSPSPVVDPRGPAVGLGPDRMIRSGSFHMIPYWHRAAQRGWHDPASRYWYLGFRPVRTFFR